MTCIGAILMSVLHWASHQQVAAIMLSICIIIILLLLNAIIISREGETGERAGLELILYIMVHIEHLH